jgi:hypothetical protein
MAFLQLLHRFVAVRDDVVVGVRPAPDQLGEGFVVRLTCYFCFSSSQKAVPPSAFINSRIFSRGMTPQRLAQA